MRGSIRKQSKSSWRITVSLGKDFATNKYTKYQETFRGTKRDAENRLAEIISELNKGITINPEKYTFGEFLDKWLKDYCQANLSDRSLYDYSYIVNEHIKPELGQIPLQKLRPIHVKDFYSKLRQEGRKDNKKSTGRGLSASYVKKIHAIIHESLNHAVRWELVYRNVADAVDPPRVVRKEVSPINEKEIDLLLRSIKGTPLYV